MTVQSTYEPTVYKLVNPTQSLSVGFEVSSEEFLKVFTKSESDKSWQEFNGGWTLAGGTITFAEPLSGSLLVKIERHTPLVQAIPFETSSGFQAKVIENALDKLVMAQQEQKSDIDTCVKIIAGSDLDPDTAYANFVDMFNEVKSILDEVKAIKQEIIALKNEVAQAVSTGKAELNGIVSSASTQMNGYVATARGWAIGEITEQPQGSAKYWANRTYQELYEEPISVANEILGE
jgi:hypothetical protein